MPKILGMVWHMLQILPTLEAVFIGSAATQQVKVALGWLRHQPAETKKTLF